MEKIVYALWRREGEAREEFNGRILASLPDALHAAGASGVRINLRDAAVDPAAGLIQQSQVTQQAAVVQFWLPSSNALFRGAADRAISVCCDRFAAWLVCESTIIANNAHPPLAGRRTWGWSQASFIAFRADIGRDAALRHWHGHHTRVAIDTQANFEYVQNVIVRSLTENAPIYDAFVEECFPPEAMTDPGAFFAAVGDASLLKSNLAAMMDSCRKFLDFTRNDIVPTSQFDFAKEN